MTCIIENIVVFSKYIYIHGKGLIAFIGHLNICTRSNILIEYDFA